MKAEIGHGLLALQKIGNSGFTVLDAVMLTHH